MVTEDDIEINKLTNQIQLNLPKPHIFSIDIDEDKTIYEEASKGLFRFGDVELTTEEFGILQKEISKTFEYKMNDSSIYDQALNATTTAITDLLTKTFSDNLSVKISFNDSE